MSSRHTSKEFEAELRAIDDGVRAMGEDCDRNLRLALTALWEGSSEGMAEAEGRDDVVDRDEKELDALVLRVFALRQPLAHDLRALMATLKVISELERVGDEAVNIAERGDEAEGPVKAHARPTLDAMSAAALAMVKDAVEAFVSQDVSLAARVIARDADVDARYAAVVRDLSDYMRAAPAETTAAVRLLKVARYLERVGDHATNVAEQAVFRAQGEDVRHGGR